MSVHSKRIVACLIVTLASAATAAAETIPVTIADGLAAAMVGAEAGDVLELECGVYLEQGIVVVPGVTIRSATQGCATLQSDGSESVLIFEQAGPNTRLVGLVFRGSEAGNGNTHRGGALRLRGSSPVVLHCEFEALQASYGGAVHCSEGSDPLFGSCRFVGNTAWAVGGVIACVDDSSPTLAGCLLVENEAGVSGGAIQATAGSQPELRECTVVENTSPAGAALSGWDLAASSHEQVIWSGQTGGSAWLGDGGSIPDLVCSDLFGNAGGDWTGTLADQEFLAGNLSADPHFCAPGTYTLNAASPCSPANSSCGRIGAFEVDCDWAVGVDNVTALATRIREAFPNPFNPSTTIRFDVAQSGRVHVEVFDVAGRKVRGLLNEVRAGGSHEVVWNGRDDGRRHVAAGVYFVRLKSSETVDVRRLTLVK